MSKLKFRGKEPNRSYKGRELSDYKQFKHQLAADFNNRCGYTDCFDFWFGGVQNFQIDHFRPKSKFPDLETTYSNLVYSCSYVNRAKSDDFIEGKYVDPASEEYCNCFYRDELGHIYPHDDSEPGKYMYIKLKLYLKRHSIIWMLDQLEKRMFVLQQLIEEKNNQEARDLLVDITIYYNNYKKYLRAIQ